jgi:hypothetical protein
MVTYNIKKIKNKSKIQTMNMKFLRSIEGTTSRDRIRYKILRERDDDHNILTQ